jgi:uncharacterized protein YbjT (DUF2867 family)
MIFVVGGTGTVGRGLLQELRAASVEARVLVRSGEKAAGVEEQGFEPVVGDLERPAELEGSLRGAESLFLLSAHHPRQAELQNVLVDTAKRAGVERVVKLSGSSAVTYAGSPSWVGRAHTQTEEKIRHEGLAFTFLRPNYFMQNLLGQAEAIRGGALPLPFADAHVAMVDARDVGAVAATILGSGGHHDGRVYDLTGPESLTFDDVATRLSAVLGQEISYRSSTVEAAAEGMRARGAPDWLVEHVQQIWEIFRSGHGAETSPVVEEILGRPPRGLEEFARDHAGVLRPAESR